MKPNKKLYYLSIACAIYLIACVVVIINFIATIGDKPAPPIEIQIERLASGPVVEVYSKHGSVTTERKQNNSNPNP